MPVIKLFTGLTQNRKYKSSTSLRIQNKDYLVPSVAVITQCVRCVSVS